MSPGGWTIESESLEECIAVLRQMTNTPHQATDIETVSSQVFDRIAPMIRNLLLEIETERPPSMLSWHVERMVDGSVEIAPVTDDNGVDAPYEPQLTARLDGKPRSHRHVREGFKQMSLDKVAPWTAPAVALFADGAVPFEVERDIEGITRQQANYVRNQYSREIAELAQLPHGEARFKYLQDRFGFGGVAADTSVGARLKVKQA